LSASPEHRREWLAGRVAAKDAVRAAVSGRTGDPLYPADVEILDGVEGGVYARVLIEDEETPELHLSLTGSPGVVSAAVAIAPIADTFPQETPWIARF
jgi:phosphopantetheinyl transferase (holo-ACP synthase)